MTTSIKQIAAGEFKAKCLQLMDAVSETHVSIVITKHGVPVAKLVPIDKECVKIFGAQADVVTIEGDIISSMEEGWDAND